MKLGFRVWCRYFTPVDIVGRWAADTFGEPIRIGDVTVLQRRLDSRRPRRRGGGSAAIAAEVVEAVEEVMRTENKVRTAILQGVDPQEAYLRLREVLDPFLRRVLGVQQMVRAHRPGAAEEIGIEPLHVGLLVRLAELLPSSSR